MTYQLWIKDEAKNEIRQLPGHMRSQVRRAINSLPSNVRPYHSIEMTPPFAISGELRRIKIEHWRIIYIVDEEFLEIGILAVRKRPPYQYDDLVELLTDLN